MDVGEAEPPFVSTLFGETPRRKMPRCESLLPLTVANGGLRLLQKRRDGSRAMYVTCRALAVRSCESWRRFAMVPSYDM